MLVTWSVWAVCPRGTLAGANPDKEGLMATAQAEPSAQDMYRMIRLIRRFEERAIAMVRSGEIAGGIHPCNGQEAVSVGICAALRPDDVLMPQHRGHGHVLAKGIDPAALLAELAGRVTGINRARGGSPHPTALTVGVLAATAPLGHHAPPARPPPARWGGGGPPPPRPPAGQNRPAGRGDRLGARPARF